jgi:hypothetical protein
MKTASGPHTGTLTVIFNDQTISENDKMNRESSGIMIFSQPDQLGDSWLGQPAGIEAWLSEAR